MQIVHGYEVMAVVPKTITEKFSNNKKSNNNTSNLAQLHL